jgi:hypothetical protein
MYNKPMNKNNNLIFITIIIILFAAGVWVFSTTETPSPRILNENETVETTESTSEVQGVDTDNFITTQEFNYEIKYGKAYYEIDKKWFDKPVLRVIAETEPTGYFRCNCDRSRNG